MRRYLLFLILLLQTGAFYSHAQQKTEAELVAKLFRALQMQDFEAYASLYATSDSLSSWILQYADVHSESYKKMAFVKNNIAAKEDYDTLIRREIDANLDTFLDKAKKWGIHWNETVFARYELEKIRRGRGLMIEKVASLRFMGYIFFRDLATRKMYGFTVYDLFQVNGKWYGGELVNIFPAENKEQYKKAFLKEQKWLRDVANGLVTADSDTSDGDGVHDGDDPHPSEKEIVDRKFYRGKFDNEIAVQLYVRSIKGACPGGVCSWDALFKFGDQDEWVPMSVSKNEEGNWLFIEEMGGMELKLEGGVYQGIWAAGDTKAEYDVKLKEANLSAKKANALDEAMSTIGEEE